MTCIEDARVRGNSTGGRLGDNNIRSHVPVPCEPPADSDAPYPEAAAMECWLAAAAAEAAAADCVDPHDRP